MSTAIIFLVGGAFSPPERAGRVPMMAGLKAHDLRIFSAPQDRERRPWSSLSNRKDGATLVIIHAGYAQYAPLHGHIRCSNDGMTG